MKYSISFLIFLVSLMGCKGDPGPAGPTPSGNIVGTLILYSDNALTLQDKSGAQVSIEGRSFSASTTADGTWTLVDVPAGVHTLVFSKTGFATQKYFNFQFVGAGTYYFPSIAYLAQIPLVTVTQIKVMRLDTTSYFTVQCKLSSSDSLPRRVGIIFDKIPIAVSPTMTFLFPSDQDIPPDSTSFSFSFRFDDYVKAEYGLSQGSKLYLRAFALPRVGSYGSYNPATSKTEIYSSGFSFTSLDSLIVP
jgi:hypothetical protein